MKEKDKLAAVKRWKEVPPAERQKRMSVLGKRRWEAMTKKQKSAHIERMNRARLSVKK